MRRRVVGLAFTVVLFSSLGHAQGDRERAAARSLASEGVTAYEEGRNAVALEQFQRAYQLAPIPTIGLWLARALAKDGQLVEANERYLAATRYEVKPNDPSVFADAQKDAAQEQAALAPRIAHLVIQVRNAGGSASSVELDGGALPTALIGVPVSVNPGERSIVAKLGSNRQTLKVTVREGETKSVILDASSGASASAAPGGSPEAAPAVAESAPASETDQAPSTASSSGKSKPIAGYVMLGVGGAALITGGVFGVIAIDQNARLEEDCPNKVCPPDRDHDRQALETNATVSLISAGAGALIGGIGLYLVLSHDNGSTASRISPWVGLNSAGVSGTF